MKKVVSILLILSIVIAPQVSHADGLTSIFKVLVKNKVESKKRVDKALYENELHREALKTIELINEKENFMTDKQVRTLKNTIDLRSGDYGKSLKTKRGQLNSIRGRLKTNKKLTIDDHKDFQEWLRDIPSNDLARYDAMERYYQRFSIPSVNIVPSSPTLLPIAPTPVLVPAL